MIGYLISIGNFSDINNNDLIKKINLHFCLWPSPPINIIQKPEKIAFILDANPDLLPLEDDLPLSGERESAVILGLPVTEPKAGVLPLLQRRRKKLLSSQNHQQKWKSLQYKRPLLLGKYIKIHLQISHFRLLFSEPKYNTYVWNKTTWFIYF